MWSLLEQSWENKTSSAFLLWSSGDLSTSPFLFPMWHNLSFNCLSYSELPKGKNWASLMASWVKNQPAMQEIQERQVQSLGWEDPLEEEMATHSSILAWEIPWTEEPGRLQSEGLQSQT